MQIGEIANQTNISVSTIRFYEKQGIIDSPTRKGNGYRSYDESTAVHLEKIKMLTNIGFSLSEIKKINDFIKVCHTAERGKHPDVLILLEKKYKEINVELDNLNKAQAIIYGFINHIV